MVREYCYGDIVMESLLSPLTKLNGETLQDFGQGSDMPWLSFRQVLSNG